MTATDRTLEAFREHLGEIHDLQRAASVLGWDQQTYMPPGGAPGRARQLATLSKVVHERLTGPDTERFLGELEGRLAPGTTGAALVREVERDVAKRRRLPPEFVERQARVTAEAQSVWERARPANDFASFLPQLEKVVALVREQAELAGYPDHPYDALLDDFEPGLATAEVRRVFAELRDRTVPLVRRIAERGDLADPAILARDFDEAGQEAFGREVAAALGYDFSRGRLDRAAHPFETTFGIGDVRITTRYDRNFLPTSLFGTMHETGHALYEQGIDPALARTPLARGTSSMVHESQSRLWENLVGRSRAFWTPWFPRLRARFPDHLADVDADTFHKLVNRVRPSLIRVEADEVTYNLHIMLRFELELELLAGSLAARDLPEAWSARMREFLGVITPSDRDGVLQDVHWSAGLFGYFPTYALGNVLSVQLLDAAREDLGDLEGQWSRGDYAPLLGWMRDRVHRHGKALTAEEVVQAATGRPLDAGPYVAYLERKFGGLYGLGAA